jgi:Ca2+-binding RTX toxin-like protein
MARVVLNDSMDFSPSTPSGDIREQSAQGFAIGSGSITVIVHGKNLTYDVFGISGGRITGYEYYRHTDLVFSIASLNMDAADATKLMRDSTRDFIEEALVGNDLIVVTAPIVLAYASRGIDTISFAPFSSGVNVSLNRGLFDIENIIGTSFKDTIGGDHKSNNLRGTGGADTIGGGIGNDTVNGGNGNDRLIGEAGRDRFIGGNGIDAFSFTAIGHMSAVTDRSDVIADFHHAQDKIVLSLIDAKPNDPDNDAFAFIGGKAFTAPGQVRAVDAGTSTILQLNSLGTTGAEALIRLAGIDADTLTKGDFIL